MQRDTPDNKGQWMLDTLKRLEVEDTDLPTTIGRPTGCPVLPPPFLADDTDDRNGNSTVMSSSYDDKVRDVLHANNISPTSSLVRAISELILSAKQESDDLTIEAVENTPHIKEIPSPFIIGEEVICSMNKQSNIIGKIKNIITFTDRQAFHIVETPNGDYGFGTNDLRKINAK